jgi:hypothetical protein
MYGNMHKKTVPKYKKGSNVRIAVKKNIFEKGYTPNYSKEIYIVSDVLGRFPATYTLKDKSGKTFRRPYLTTELVPAGTNKNINRIKK